MRIFLKYCMVFCVLLLPGCVSVTARKAPQKVIIEEVQPLPFSERRRVAVIDFVDKSAYGKGRLGTAAADILITELSRSGRFILVERPQLKKVLSELHLESGKEFDTSTIHQIGNQLGVDAIVYGVVSQFGVRVTGTDVLIFQTKRQDAEAEVDVRAIDVSTGQILFSESGRGQTRIRASRTLFFGGQVGYDETLAGDALRAAIVKFTDNLIETLSKGGG